MYGSYAAKQLESYFDCADDLARDLQARAAKASEVGDAGGQTCLLRLQLIQEELAELAEAIRARNIVDVLDALTDLD
ncbi:hypothetical protein, partial [Streptomyces sp. P17]|uniref:hypothetical protein n=1 Tax=Streptomyces sp. P17 TaxID=3074716 RepID=UPI0037DCF667